LTKASRTSSRTAGASGRAVSGRLLRRARILLGEFQRALRATEPAQILACAILGSVTGVVTSILRQSVWGLHSLDFGVPAGDYLSTGIGLDYTRVLFAPAIGGLVLGLVARALRRWRSTEVVDPIEANALYGGRMSFIDSLRLTLTTMISNAAGASLGMEAGYSQLGASIFSSVGQYLRLRRSDLRTFVTAGAGAAIAAAFNAPLAGAFYGYELISGSYTVRALAPVAAATVCAALTQRGMSHTESLFVVPSGVTLLSLKSYLLFGVMGVFAAGTGVLTMQSVTWIERGMRRTGLPDWLRPAVGGILLSAVAYFFPQVLGSGHGAIQYHFDHRWALIPLVTLLVAKLAASALSVGTGFRGGLFSSSLFLGCLFGAAFGQIASFFMPSLADAQLAFILAGMGSVAAAIVGAPFTMVFLVLEATSDFTMTIAVLVAVTVSSTIVRLSFGYSFATWRFHLRGLGIRGAHDVGWISDLSVGRLMRADPRVVAAATPLRAMRETYPVGSVKRVFVIDDAARYLGVIDVPDMHDPEIDAATDFLVAGDLAQGRDLFLLPGENVRTALLRFEESQTETLPVLSDRTDRRVQGYMTEAYALRRYTQELERTRSAELGEQDLFSLGRPPGP
jgi:CIC family chloride channel protein